MAVCMLDTSYRIINTCLCNVCECVVCTEWQWPQNEEVPSQNFKVSFFSPELQIKRSELNELIRSQ